MKRPFGNSIASLLLAAALALGGGAAAGAAELELKAKCQAQAAVVTLGDVAEIRAADANQTRLLAGTELFTAPAPGQQRVVRVREIQDLLAMRLVNLAEHRFTGASQVLVLAGGDPSAPDRQLRVTVGTPPRRAPGAGGRGATAPRERCRGCGVERAPGLEREPSADGSQRRPAADRAGRTRPWTGTQQFELVLGAAGHAQRVPVTAEVAVRAPVVSASVALARGAVIRPEDVQLERAAADAEGAFHSLDEVVGRELSQAVAAGTVLQPAMLQAQTLVRRGEVITVYARAAGIRVRTTARCRQDGGQGDLVTVESLLDRKVFTARVIGIQEAEVYARAIRAEPAPAREAAEGPGALVRTGRRKELAMSGGRDWKGMGLALAAGFVLLASADARGQSSSLFGTPVNRKPLTMADASFTYTPPADPKVWKLNDLVTVIIEEKTRMVSEGQVDQRKKIEGAMALKDWISLNNFNLAPAAQEEGDPTVAGIVDNKYRAQANLQNRNSFESQMQCVVSDVRPNGTLVIEGHGKVQIDEEEWELSLSGIVQPEDILPNNSIKSDKIAEKRIVRRSAGQGRDGIRRGFIQRSARQIPAFLSFLAARRGMSTDPHRQGFRFMPSSTVRRSLIAVVALAFALVFPGLAAAQMPLKTICRVKGQEENTLHGLGIVVGLKGTGDGGSSLPMLRSLAQAMQHLGNPTGQDRIGGTQGHEERGAGDGHGDGASGRGAAGGRARLCDQLDRVRQEPGGRLSVRHADGRPESQGPARVCHCRRADQPRRADDDDDGPGAQGRPPGRRPDQPLRAGWQDHARTGRELRGLPGCFGGSAC